MKRFSPLTAVLLILATLLALAGCGATEPLPEPVPTPPSAYLPYVGAYTLFGVRHGDYIVDPTALDIEIHSVLTLEDGGMGTLSINGESGRIGSWTISGDTIILNPGASPMTGLYRDGVVILSMDDGSTLYYAVEGADRTAFPLIGRDEYTAILAAEALAEAEREERRKAEELGKPRLPGEYSLYSIKRGDVIERVEDFGAEDSMHITLRDDGSGEILLPSGRFEISWSVEDTILSFRDSSGFLGDLSGVVKRDGVFALGMKNIGEGVVYTFQRIDPEEEEADADSDAAQSAPTAG